MNRKDILECLALRIDDLYTLKNFALTCRAAHNAVIKVYRDKIDDVKKLYRFEVVEQDEIERTHCHWLGKFTRGDVGCRGTRVWLLPSSHCKLLIDSPYDLPYSFEPEFATRLLLDPSGSFPGDAFNIRREELEEIYQTLLNPPKIKLDGSRLNFAYGTQEEFRNEDLDITKEFTPEVNELFLGLHYDSKILYYYNSIWIVDDLSEIVEELKQILSLCDVEGVDFDWV